MSVAGIKYYFPTFGNIEDDAIAGLTADCNGNIPLLPKQTYAINGNSKQKHAAWEFLKILLSEEIQSQTELFGYPVNRNALEEYAMTEVMMGGMRQNQNPVNDGNRQAFYDYLQCINDFADSVNTYTLRDARISEWINEEAGAYFKGEKSAKDAAAVLQNKVNLYLNE
jgi:multiple sugar transport system substrate-binding protein